MMKEMKEMNGMDGMTYKMIKAYWIYDVIFKDEEKARNYVDDMYRGTGETYGTGYAVVNSETWGVMQTDMYAIIEGNEKTFSDEWKALEYMDKVNTLGMMA